MGTWWNGHWSQSSKLEDQQGQHKQRKYNSCMAHRQITFFISFYLFCIVKCLVTKSQLPFPLFVFVIVAIFIWKSVKWAVIARKFTLQMTGGIGPHFWALTEPDPNQTDINTLCTHTHTHIYDWLEILLPQENISYPEPQTHWTPHT